MVTQELHENKFVLDRFRRVIRNQRLAHAYLFIGPEGIGKGQTALAVAKLINCEKQERPTSQSYCGVCSACRRIDSGNFPDVTVIGVGQDSSIRISQVREIITRMQLRAYEAAVKIFIIEKIEDLSLEGSHALLKTLEEPSKDSLFILTTDVLEKNLSTIRSRCHAVYFFAQDRESLMQSLQASSHLQPDVCHFLVTYAQGYPGRAQRFSQQGLLERRNAYVDGLILKRNDSAVLKKVVADRGQTKEALDILLSWFRDVLLLKAGAQRHDLMHRDRFTDLERTARRYTHRQTEDIINEVVRNARLLDANLNIKIAMQILMEKIWQK